MTGSSRADITNNESDKLNDDGGTWRMGNEILYTTGALYVTLGMPELLNHLNVFVFHLHHHCERMGP